MKAPFNLKALSAALLLACGLVAVPSGAETIYVAPDGDDANPGTTDKPKRCIQDLLDTWLNTAGREIVLKKGTYYLQTIKKEGESGALHSNKSGTIRGETGNPEDVIIDGDATTECVRLAGSLVVHGITFQNGKKASDYAYGANLSVQGMDVVVSNCIIRSAGEGGQNYPAAGLVNGARLLDCRFLGVTGTVAGAALNMPTNNIVRGCVFRDCHVPLLGASSGSPACLVRMRAESLLADCVFTNNFGLSLHATCVNTETGVSTVSNCLFTANTNTYAACWAQDNVVVRECRFTGNSASYSAGALSTFPGTTVTNCVFADNTAHFFGGALITRSTLDNPTRVVDCVFANNTAGAGGAVSVGFTYQLIPEKYDNMVNGYLLMDRCLISNNVANVVRGHGTYLGGGGIFVAGKAIEAHSGGEITNCQIVDNHSDWEGGGLCVRNWTGSSGFTGSWPLLIRNCLIARNSAGWEGGGLYIIHNGADGRYVMDSCTVVSNTAASTPPYTLGSAGHGLYHKLPGFFCTNTVFALNTLVTDKPQNFDHCCFDPAQGLPGSGAVNMTPSSGDSATNSKTCDARLANPDAGDYRLATASSPCCNAGLMEAWMADAVDLDGNARVFSSAPDMGCYELSWPLGTYLLIR